MAYPIPSTALDDRLAFVGTAGSGKTYAAGTAVEKLLAKKARVVICDPLGVWYGLRLAQDGKAPGFPVVIFGGEHGDLPLTEHVGKLIGETVAGMAESCIVSLEGLGSKAAERRFMLAFLETMYRKASGEPVHLVFDEADLWAPQKSGEPHLQALMENIVRRGRVRGFIPWLITQRPAVLSKDVLSQADGIIAMKLTASQDRDALGAWIEGQADRAEEKRILASLPQVGRGRGIVWIPGRGVLEEAAFPEKVTFDSSRTPQRGEKKRATELKPLDLGKLKERLGKVEAETKANDPRTLRAEITALRTQLAKAVGNPPATDPKAIEAAERRGYERGHSESFEAGVEAGWQVAGETVAAVFSRDPPKGKAKPPKIPASPPVRPDPPRASQPAKLPAGEPVPRREATGDLTPSRQKIVDALAWLETIGQLAPKRNVTAFIVGVSPKSSGYEKYVSELRTAGLIDYPGSGCLALTDAGRAVARAPDAPRTHEAVMNLLRQQIAPAVMRLLEAAVGFYPTPVSRADLAGAAGVSPTSSGFEKYVSQLSSLGLVTYPAKGEVRAADLLFPG